LKLFAFIQFQKIAISTVISLDSADVCKPACYGMYRSFHTIYFLLSVKLLFTSQFMQGKVEAAVHESDGQGRLRRPIALAMAGENLYSRGNVHSKRCWGRE